MGNSSAPRTGFLWNAFLTAACLALAVLVVLLARQNRALEADLEEARGQIAVARVGEGKDLLEEGDLIPPIRLADADGHEAELTFDGGGAPRSLLMFFSVECPACQETLPLWEEAYGAGSEPAADVFAVRLDPGGGAHEGPPPAIPVYEPLEPSDVPVDRMVIPAAFLVDAHGFIERAWYGVPSNRQLAEIESILYP